MGKEAVIPTREFFCRVAAFSTPFTLVFPPHQKFPSSDTQSRADPS